MEIEENLKHSEFFMDLTPNDIRNYEFSSKMRGFDKDEVTELLADLATALEKVKEDNLRISMQNDSLKSQINSLKQFEDTIKKAAIDARRNADETVEQAKIEASSLLENARLKAGSLVDDKEKAVDALNSQIEQLEKTKKTFISDLRSLINMHIDQIDNVASEDIKKNLADTSSINVTDSKDITRYDMETLADQPKEEIVEETPKDEKKVEDAQVPESEVPDSELTEALKSYTEHQHPTPTAPTPIPETPPTPAPEAQHVPDSVIPQTPTPAPIPAPTPETSEQPPVSYENTPNIDVPVMDNPPPKPGEYYETDRPAEEVPAEFIPKKEVTETDITSTGPAPNMVPDDIASELDNVVAKFEEEMDKADKN